jgi:hypothetical protein
VGRQSAVVVAGLAPTAIALSRNVFTRSARRSVTLWTGASDLRSRGFSPSRRPSLGHIRCGGTAGPEGLYVRQAADGALGSSSGNGDLHAARCCPATRRSSPPRWGPLVGMLGYAVMANRGVTCGDDEVVDTVTSLLLHGLGPHVGEAPPREHGHDGHQGEGEPERREQTEPGRGEAAQ